MSADLILLAPDPTPDRDLGNPYHDELGRFTDKGGASRGGSVSKGGSWTGGRVVRGETAGMRSRSVTGTAAGTREHAQIAQPTGKGQNWQTGGVGRDQTPARGPAKTSASGAASSDRMAAETQRIRDWQNNTDRGRNEDGGAKAYPGDKIDAGAYGKHYVVGEHNNYYLVVSKKPANERAWERETADPPLNGAISKSQVKRVIQTAWNNGLQYHPPLEYKGKPTS